MRRLTAALAFALAGTALACSDSTKPSESLVGTWNLSTVNGAPLPFTLQASNPKVEVVQDQFVGTADDRFTENGTGRFTSSTGVVSNVSFTDAGTWTVNGNAITIRFDSDNSSLSGSIDGSTLTVGGFGLSQVYLKQ